MSCSSSGSDIYQQIPSLMKHTASSNTKRNVSVKAKSKPKKDTKKEEEQLTKKMKEYQKQIKELKNQIKDDEANTRYIATLNQTSEQYDKLIKTYEATIQQLKNSESNLLEELQGQTNISKEALNKLYQFQQEYATEKEKLKQYYEEYYKDKQDELIKKYELQILQIQSQSHRTHDTGREDIMKKIKDYQQREQLYLEEIELLKSKSLGKKGNHKENELRQKLVDMELKMQEWDDGLDRMKQLERENQELLLKVNSYEKKLVKKEEKENRLKEEWNRQYLDLQNEIRYWKQEMDKVIMENNLVLSKLTPQKRKY